MQEGEKKKIVFLKKMSNYFSFGVDARVGYGFDKNRTKSRFKNKTVYCWEGFKKIFTKTPKLNDVLQKAETISNKEEEVILITSCS